MSNFDCNKLKDCIANDLDKLAEVLENYGFKSPHIAGNKIRCGWDESSKGDGIIISPCEYRGVAYKRFSTGDDGDIISLICDKTGREFKVVIKELYQIFKDGYDNSNYIGINTDFVEKFKKKDDDDNDSYDILSEGLLGAPEISLRLLKDGILPSVQVKFGLWYDDYYNRICFNWRDINGNLVGVNGRINEDDYADNVPKYYPVLINFKKGLHLYGLYENKEHIKGKYTAIIFESEKSVLQCSGFGCKLAVAVGSASITIKQLRLLDFLGVKNLIFAFDEGINSAESMEKIKDICNQNGMVFNLKYIHDNENRVMSKGSKCSPADMGKDKFYELLRNFIIDF